LIRDPTGAELGELIFRLALGRLSFEALATMIVRRRACREWLTCAALELDRRYKLEA